MLQKLNAELIEKNLELQQNSTKNFNFKLANYYVELLVEKNTELKENMEKENSNNMELQEKNKDLIKLNTELNTRMEIIKVSMEIMEGEYSKLFQNNIELQQKNKELMKQNTEHKEFWNKFLHSPWYGANINRVT